MALTALETPPVHDAPTRTSGIYRYKHYLGRRFTTMACALEMFRVGRGKTIVELGTSRSYVPGGTEGCMVDDTEYWQPSEPGSWDWGSGLFTRVAAEHLADVLPTIHSVDTSASAISISSTICEPFLHLIRYHHASSVRFLNAFRGKIDLLYMDAGEADDGAEWLHLQEAQLLIHRGLMAQDGLILIDDVEMPEGYVSKGELSVPLFRRHGYRVLASDYQCLILAP